MINDDEAKASATAPSGAEDVASDQAAGSTAFRPRIEVLTPPSLITLFCIGWGGLLVGLIVAGVNMGSGSGVAFMLGSFIFGTGVASMLLALTASAIRATLLQIHKDR